MMTDEKQQRIDESLAKQLQHSMELNARMKNRLAKLAYSFDSDDPYIANAVRAIINDEEPS